MLKNYFLSAFRFIARNRKIAFINIAGLAIGISSAILIMLFVVSENSYDKHHNDASRIFRLNSDLELDGKMDHLARNSLRAGPEMKEMFPEVESYMRLNDIGKQSVFYETKMFTEKKVAFADSTFFDFFSYRSFAGDLKHALDQPQSICISKEVAEKYFENPNDALGKMLRFALKSYKVTGVFEVPEEETHLKYDFLISINSINRANYQVFMGDYFRMMSFTYLKLKPGVDPQAFSKKFPTFYKTNIEPWIKQNNVTGKLEYTLQPISDIHLNTSLEYDYPGNSKRSYLYIFGITGIFILLIASINYMNLSTANSIKRAKEVGIRMVGGASKGQLVVQFLGEALIVTFAGFLLSLAIVELLLPLFNQLTGKQFGHASVFQPEQLALMFGLVFLTGLIAGSYPAFFLTSLRPSSIFKMQTAAKKGVFNFLFNPVRLRKFLVVLQFTIAIGLMIGTFVVSGQLYYMKNKDLGFNKESILVIQVPGDSITRSNLPVIKNEFSSRRDVSGIASTSTVPGSTFGQLYFIVDGNVNKFLGFNWVDEDYFKVLGIKVSGRNFSKDNAADENSFIINKACADFLGWKDPIGHEMENGFGVKGKVIGVVDNFNFASLHNPVSPMVYMYTPQTAGNLMIRITGDDPAKTSEEILDRWKRFDPNHPLETFFLDDHINENYVKESNMLKIFGYFTVLAIVISCLGLFGLATFTTQQRTKEIGVRKVLGAGTRHITLLITGDFLKLVLLSGLPAIPLSWYFLDKWISAFAYTEGLSWIPFAGACLIALAIAGVTVSFLAYRSASANPVKSLRYE